jgi:hypothetical protein
MKKILQSFFIKFCVCFGCFEEGNYNQVCLFGIFGGLGQGNVWIGFVGFREIRKDPFVCSLVNHKDLLCNF